MITRTYFDKINTIIKDSEYNNGINPVAEMIYGKSLTRILLHFDINHIKENIEDKTFADVEKIHHYLKLTNAGFVDFKNLHRKQLSKIDGTDKVRTSSFDLLFFLIPQEWDGGKGYDNAETLPNDLYITKFDNQEVINGRKLMSKDGSTWYQARNGYEWKEEGVFTTDTLINEYQKYLDGEDSVVIGKQHFDIGNENINLDITNVINRFLNGTIPNYGIGIAFSPTLEATKDNKDNYVGFFSRTTNTCFEPYVETVYDDYIDDNRNDFALNKTNRLFLYCYFGDNLDNLDEMPRCIIDEKEYPVRQFSKGIYYATVKITSDSDNFNGMMCYDVWTNLKYKGDAIEDVELEFTVKTPKIFFNVGKGLRDTSSLTPSIYGIDSDEKIKRGDIRKVGLLVNTKYKRNEAQNITNAEYRIYIKDGEREFDVINWEKVNKTYNENYFLVDTNILPPNKYYIDVRIKTNLQTIIHNNLISFFITENLNNKYL